MKISQILPFLLTAQTYACGLHRRDNSSDPNLPTIATRVKPAAPTGKVAIVNVRIFNGYEVENPSTVFVDGTKISAPLNKVDRVIDGEGGILFPGFIDSHNHVQTTDDLEQLSGYGVTTAFVMNCYNYETCSSLRGQTGLTDVRFASYSAKGVNSSHAINGDAPLNRLITSPQQAPSYVAQAFGNGSDYLKIVSEQNGPDQATQNALVQNAHNIGQKVMTHATILEYYLMAIYSNTDGPQHVPLDYVLNDTALHMMYANGQFSTPTMAVYHRELMVPGAPAALGVPQGSFNASWPIIKQNVRAIHKAGVPILAGTDASDSYGGQSVPFGTTLHDEMYYLTEAGLTNLEALRAATLMPVLSHGLTDRGRIAPGLRADMVLLQPDADPLKTINDTRKLARVWNAGYEYLNLTLSCGDDC